MVGLGNTRILTNYAQESPWTLLRATSHTRMKVWTIFKNHLLEVGLTQKLEPVVFQNLTTVDTYIYIYIYYHV